LRVNIVPVQYIEHDMYRFVWRPTGGWLILLKANIQIGNQPWVITLKAFTS